jgi:hypothetical protein
MNTIYAPNLQKHITGTTINANKRGLDVVANGGNTLFALADYVAATFPTATQEVYTYRTGGSGGTVVATVTVNYLDAIKDNILSLAIT